METLRGRKACTIMQGERCSSVPSMKAGGCQVTVNEVKDSRIYPMHLHNALSDKTGAGKLICEGLEALR